MNEKYLSIIVIVIFGVLVAGCSVAESHDVTPENNTTLPDVHSTAPAATTVPANLTMNNGVRTEGTPITNVENATVNTTTTPTPVVNNTVNTTATPTYDYRNETGDDGGCYQPKPTTRTITDMAGREVTIPLSISKVLSTCPPPTTFIYMLAPDKLGGCQWSFSEESKKYIPEEYRDLPVVGWGNPEAYIAANPDVIFTLFEKGSNLAMIDEQQEKYGSIPLVCVDNARNATGYETTLRFMGDILGVPDVADTEIAYYQEVLDEVQTGLSEIPESERLRVYYAEGADGLKTDPSGSCHSQLIDLCGGINVADCDMNMGRGMTAVTKESVLKWSPDVIITTSSEFAERIYGDEFWSQIPAVKNHRVYLAPKHPFNWFDRPPGVNRIVGIPWTAHALYPDQFSGEWLDGRVKEFYSTFYHYELTNDELRELIPVPTRTITDMAGREVTIPLSISKVLCTCPPPTTFVYMLAPDKLGGWQWSFSEESEKYIPEKYRNLPVIGWRPLNPEAYIAENPDLIFMLFEKGWDQAMIDEQQEKFGSIPVVCVDDARNATGYEATFRFMGDVLGVPDVADTEIAYYREVLDEVQTGVSAIPESERLRVYYAVGADGLKTAPSGTCNAQLIDLCGGINVADCEVNAGCGCGITAVTKESVLGWKPDVIIATSSEFAERVADDEFWSQIPAVQNHRVYVTPNYPFNWFDRPPGVNRIVGIPWTAHVLYPDRFSGEWLDGRAKEFYSTFYHYELTDEEISALLGF